LPAAVRDAIVRHARLEAPRECCGFLIGRRGRVQFALPTKNVARQPTVRYEIDSWEHVRLRRWLRRFQPPLEILGVYHSHPNGKAFPSEADRAEANYPRWLFVIAGGPGRRTVVRSFRIVRGLVRRVGWAGV